MKLRKKNKKKTKKLQIIIKRMKTKFDIRAKLTKQGIKPKAKREKKKRNEECETPTTHHRLSSTMHHLIV
jgi:hypothetical protein